MLTKEEKKAIVRFLLFVFIGIPLILIASPYIIATFLLFGSVGGSGLVSAFRRLFN